MKVGLSTVCALLIFAACSQAPPADVASNTLTVTFPAGDAQAGRKAFLDLRCTACHAVPSESGFPAPVSANPGPAIDERVASLDASHLATALVSPSHALSSGLDETVQTQLTGVLSPMGDFSYTMTVRQFIDLYSYLRSKK